MTFTPTILESIVWKLIILRSQKLKYIYINQIEAYTFKNQTNQFKPKLVSIKGLGEPQQSLCSKPYALTI